MDGSSGFFDAFSTRLIKNFPGYVPDRQSLCALGYGHGYILERRDSSWLHA